MPGHKIRKAFTDFSKFKWDTVGYRVDKSYARTAAAVLVPNHPVNFVYGETQATPFPDTSIITSAGVCEGTLSQGYGQVEYIAEVYFPEHWRTWIPGRLAECRIVVGLVSNNFVSPDLSTLTFTIEVSKVLDYAQVLLKKHLGDCGGR